MTKKTIRFVVADDDEILLDVLRSALAMQGHACETFTSAEAALEHLSETPCSILITDIVMQGMKGLQLTKQVKQLWPDTSVIVMTGFIEDFSYDEAIEAGASDFIKKPFTVHELMIRVKHVLLQEKMREMAVTDELTGLLNRRGFFAIGQQQLKVARRNSGQLALLFADMDGFKSINDRLGHHAGDDALKSMAEILRRTFRDSDVIARISGDEFALLLLDSPERNVEIAVQRLQRNLDVYNVGAGGACTLAVSVGVAMYEAGTQGTIEELLKQADARMYQQKQRKKTGT